jgi:hypothetical protein
MIGEALVYFEETSIEVQDRFIRIIGIIGFSLAAFAVLFWIIRRFRR